MTRYHYLRNVVTLRFATDKCIGCGMCTIVCPHAVFAIHAKKARIINRDDCMECGACARNCPKEAITVRAGVGCANAIIKGAIKGTEPTCGDSCCDSTPSCC